MSTDEMVQFYLEVRQAARKARYKTPSGESQLWLVTVSGPLGEAKFLCTDRPTATFVINKYLDNRNVTTHRKKRADELTVNFQFLIVTVVPTESVD